MEFARAEGFDFVPEQKKPDAPKLIYSQEVLFAQFWSRILLGAILFVAFIAGAWIAGTALHDPDTCWLLALGREIYNHGIPSTDPFSYTFAGEAAAGKTFVLYQWLAELLFYVTTLSGSLLPLLMLAAVCIVTAFLSLPLNVAVKREAPFLPGCLAVILGMLSASFHTLARPEIFSFVFLSIYVQLLHHVRAAHLTGVRTLFPMVLVAAPLMVLWANMHTGFTSGMSIIAACLLGGLLSLSFLGQRALPFISTFGVTMLGIIIASLITPYNIRLWQYIPTLFFCKTNAIIVELAPLDVTKVVYAPFLLLIAFWLFAFVKAFNYLRELKASAQSPQITQSAARSEHGEHAQSMQSAQAAQSTKALHLVRASLGSAELAWKLLALELLVSGLIGAIGIFNAFRASRLVSFVAIMLVSEVTALLGARRIISGSGDSEFAEVVEAAKGREIATASNATEHANASDISGSSTALTASATTNTSNALNALTASATTAPTRRSVWWHFDHHATDLWKTGGTGELAIVCFCAMAGVSLVADRVMKPELPASSVAFKVPDAAIKYVEGHLKELPGNVFNDPQIGDVMIWRHPTAPKVFIDTRFDMYGDRLVSDYVKLNKAEPGFEALMAKYDIGWIFVKPDSPLGVKLKNNPGWATLHSDEAALILRRNK